MNATNFQYSPEFRRCQLEGILNDCMLVYSKITSSRKGIENNENKIRDKITDYLMNDNYKKKYTSVVKDFQVDKEVQEGDNGRTDIRFLQASPYQGQKVYFTIECKRLDGKAILSKEYVVNGLDRFKDPNKYATPLGCNAMIGFIVRTIKVDDTCNEINSHLAADEYLVKIHEELPEGCYKFESIHLIKETITLIHLWMDFTSCIVHSKVE